MVYPQLLIYYLTIWELLDPRRERGEEGVSHTDPGRLSIGRLILKQIMDEVQSISIQSEQYNYYTDNYINKSFKLVVNIMPVWSNGKIK